MSLGVYVICANITVIKQMHAVAKGIPVVLSSQERVIDQRHAKNYLFILHVQVHMPMHVERH